MGHGPERRPSDSVQEHPLFLETCHDLLGWPTGTDNVEYDDVRFHAIRVKRDGWDLLEQSGETPGMFMILFEARDIVLKRVDAGGSQNPGLPHPATIHSPEAAKLVHHRPVTRDNQRADRRAKSLREAERDRLEMTRIFRGGHSRSHNRVEQPGSIQMHRNPMRQCDLTNSLDRGERIDRPAPAVVSVLQTDEPGGERVRFFWPDRRVDLHRIKDAPFAGQAMDLHPRQGGGSALLIPDDMGPALDNDFVPRPRLDPDGQLVGHRT